MKQHLYEIRMSWTGNLGEGTKRYTGYSRNHEIVSAGKPILLGSSDPSFLGDPARYNPEELLVASLSTCHMLWYLHLCAEAGVVVEEYSDAASGIMEERPDASGVFVEVTLRPAVTISAESDAEQALALHEEAHRKCFIANSMNFPVRHEPRVVNACPVASTPSRAGGSLPDRRAAHKPRTA
jgi:organic hydroperoxide reductase OsmC/OhrA